MHSQPLKPSLILALLLISSATSFGQFTHDIRYGVKPKGDIRSCTSSQANVNDTLFKEIKSIDYLEYNRKGQLIKSWKASKLNEQSIDTKFVKTFTYDKKGNLTKVIHYDSKGAPSKKDTYLYVHSGRFIIIKEQIYNGDTSRSSEQFKIDASGKILVSYLYSSKTDTSAMLLRTTTYYKYDSTGHRIEEITNDANGQTISKRINEYNKYGDLSHFINSGDLTSTGAFKHIAYDSHHNWISSILFNSLFGDKPVARFKRQITYYK